MKRAITVAAAIAGAALILLAAWTVHRHLGGARHYPPYSPPAGATVTQLPALEEGKRTLLVEAATDISFMRPFLRDFQRLHPDVSITYSDMLSTQLLDRALVACRTGEGVADIYLTVATDHLVRLANDGCGRTASSDAATAAPGWRKWRDEVFAFALEPAVFVYDRRALSDAEVPRSHLQLIQMLRSNPAAWDGRIGTYDIRQSGIAYNFAEFDARQSSIFGRLIEGMGRSHVRLFCCSNEMVSAVDQGRIRLAYNVQLSYAYFALVHSDRIGIVIPSDYQAVQTRSLMIPRDARHVAAAETFLDYLLSSRAQALDRQLLTAPGRGGGERFVESDRLLSQIDVSAELLRLQDAARRRRLIREWSQAVSGSEPPH